MSSIRNISEVPTQHSDCNLCGFDGSVSIHTLLLLVHSEFLKDILMSVQDITDTSVIVPDFSVQELETLASVIYGCSKSVLVSESIMKTLGIFEFERVKIEYYDDLMVIYDGPLQGFRLIDPTKKFYLSLPPTKPPRKKSQQFSDPDPDPIFSPPVEQYSQSESEFPPIETQYSPPFPHFLPSAPTLLTQMFVPVSKVPNPISSLVYCLFGSQSNM